MHHYLEQLYHKPFLTNQHKTNENIPTLPILTSHLLNIAEFF